MMAQCQVLGWCYQQHDQIVGIVSTEELARLIAEGHVDGRATVWKIWQGDDRRHVLQTRADLALGLASTAPPNRLRGKVKRHQDTAS
jgi:hypothetical protein